MKKFSKLLSATMVLTTICAPIGTASADGNAGGPAVSTSAPLDFAQAGTWAQDAILKAKDLQLMSGDPDGNFRPHDTLTREEAAVILANLLHLNVSSDANVSFADVPASEWSYNQIVAVQAAGLMKGYEDGSFRPKQSITREELALVLAGAAGLTTKNQGKSLGMADKNQVSSWAQDGVAAVIEKRIMVGDGTNFHPKQQVTRQEMAVVAVQFASGSNVFVQSGTVGNVADGSVTLNGVTYQASDALKSLFSNVNATVLQGAHVQFVASGSTLTGIKQLEITSGGQAAASLQPEFSGDLVLDGGNSVIDGDCKVSADYVTVKNLTVNGNLEIGQSVQNDFYSANLTVKGQTLVEGGSPHTVVFENSTLGDVVADKPSVHIQSRGNTLLGQMFIHADTIVEYGNAASSSYTIPKITVLYGSHLTLNANADDVEVQGPRPTTITGSGEIGSLTLSTSSTLTVQTTGSIKTLNVTNKDAKFTLDPTTKVDNLELPAGVNPSDVIQNFDQVKSSIQNINGTKNPDASSGTTTTPAPPVSVGSGGSGSTGGSTGSGSTGSGSTGGSTGVSDFRDVFSPTDTDGYGFQPSSFFKSPDGNPLTYSWNSSDPTIATVNWDPYEVTHSYLYVTPTKKLGTTVITITATDSTGHQTSKSFNYTEINLHILTNGPILTGNSVDVTSSMDGTAYLYLQQNGVVYTETGSFYDNLVAAHTAAKATIQAGQTATLSTNGLEDGLYALILMKNDGTFTFQGNGIDIMSDQSQLDAMALNRVNQAYSTSDMQSALESAGLNLNLGTDYPALNAQGKLLVAQKVIDERMALTSSAGQFADVASVQSAFDSAVAYVKDHLANNHPPTGTVPDQTLVKSSIVKTIDLNTYIKDPDNDPITFSNPQSSDNNTVVAALYDGSQLQLDETGVGPATISFSYDDGYGGQGTSSFNVTYADAPPLAQPQVSPIYDDSTWIKGTAEPNAKVSIVDSTQAVNTATFASSDGSFSIWLQNPLPIGTVLTVTQTDATDNSSEPETVTVVKDTTPPAGPTVQTFTDSDTMLTGYTDPSCQITVSDSTGHVVGTGTADTGGTFHVQFLSPFAAGTNLTVVSTDPDGNVSPATTVTVVATPTVN